MDYLIIELCFIKLFHFSIDFIRGDSTPIIIDNCVNDILMIVILPPLNVIFVNIGTRVK